MSRVRKSIGEATNACSKHKLVEDATRNSRELDESGGARTIPERLVVEVQKINNGLVKSPARVVVRGHDDQLEDVHVGVALQVTMCLLTVYVKFQVVVDKLAFQEYSQQR